MKMDGEKVDGNEKGGGTEKEEEKEEEKGEGKEGTKAQKPHTIKNRRKKKFIPNEVLVRGGDDVSGMSEK